MKNPIATIEMSSGNKIVIELFPENAPNTVNSFIWVAKKGYYDNQDIIRIVPGFVVQSSYRNFDNPELNYLIDGEFTSNGFEKGLNNVPGCVAMGGDGKKYASCCGFYITLEYHARLDGNYPVFGKVIEGWDEVRRIEKVATEPVDIGKPGVEVNKPIVPETMVKVTVETHGVEYPDPILIPNEN
ncbi:MAG: peptidylprolyl isomerase [Defluviitaleaceae bacterium]|nr:peptidylprolyl isomerase [Defluviitaleaceae bacterium]